MNSENARDVMKYIFGRLLEYADDAHKKRDENPDDLFYQGQNLAFVIMEDVISSELAVYGENPSDYGFEAGE